MEVTVPGHRGGSLALPEGHLCLLHGGGWQPLFPSRAGALELF